MKLRFSIRDILWLTLAVGMALTWWIDHTIRYADTVKQTQQYREEVVARERDLAILRSVIEEMQEQYERLAHSALRKTTSATPSDANRQGF